MTIVAELANGYIVEELSLIHIWALTDPANDIYTETSSGNIGAKDIGKFINSVKINGGYYMACLLYTSYYSQY